MDQYLKYFSEDKMETKKITSFQFIRFIAFLNIFLLHSDEWGCSFISIRYNASWAVSFFIILSGFLSGYKHEQYGILLDVQEAGRYIWKKVKKFYPLLLITTLAMVPYSEVVNYLDEKNWRAIGENVKQLGLNLLLLQSWKKEGYFSFNGVTWFLSTIFFLYVLTIPLLVFLNKVLNRRKGYLYLGSVFTVAVIVSILWGVLCRKFGLQLEYYTYIFPLSRVAEYVAGVVCGMVISSFILNHRAVKWYWGSVPEIASMVVIFAMIGYAAKGHMMYSWEWLIPNLLLIAVFSFQSGVLSKIFSGRIFVALGDISLECFLIHLILIRYYSSAVSVNTRLASGFSQIYLLGSTLLISFYLKNASKRLLQERLG